MSLIIQFILKRKIASGAIALALIAGGYFGYTKIFSANGAIRYVTAQVQKGTLIVSISGSGQISALDQIDVKPKVSGDVVYVGVKNGDAVKAGKLLVQIDTKDAERAVSDAQLALDQAKLNLEKMKGLTIDAGTIRGDKEKAEDDLAKTYEDGFNTVSNAFLDFPDIVSGLQNALYGSAFRTGQWNIDYYVNAIQNALGIYPYEAYKFRNDAAAAYESARAAYDLNFSKYKSASRFSSTAAIENLINQIYATTQLIAESVKTTTNLIQLYKDRLIENKATPQSLADTYLSQLSGYTSKANSYLSILLSAKTTIQSDKEAIINVGFNVSDQEIIVAKAERSLADAKDALAEHFIRAPFAGTVAKVNVKKGDTVSGSVATLITNQKAANITLNEIDAAKIKIGQKATLTFDAVPDVTIAGEVTDIDTLGTVSQGVVSYTVQIAFIMNDDRIKSGMTVSAAIITEAKPDVLLVPNSAVKSQGGMSYVEIVDGDDRNLALAANASGAVLKNSPRRQSVEIRTANDESTEIINGLKEGDLVVSRTIQPTAVQTTQTQQQSGGLRIPGIPGGGGR